mmetsp:Transcript_990/g.4349  ORF Transcript_990/g.4349 Transcript_990/m.4349 type:complete len:209 (-) Transcript_990:1187-1813(-)
MTSFRLVPGVEASVSTLVGKLAAFLYFFLFFSLLNLAHISGYEIAFSPRFPWMVTVADDGSPPWVSFSDPERKAISSISLRFVRRDTRSRTKSFVLPFLPAFDAASCRRLSNLGSVAGVSRNFSASSLPDCCSWLLHILPLSIRVPRYFPEAGVSRNFFADFLPPFLLICSGLEMYGTPVSRHTPILVSSSLASLHISSKCRAQIEVS